MEQAGLMLVCVHGGKRCSSSAVLDMHVPAASKRSTAWPYAVMTALSTACSHGD
jgi:hypothetical protein